MEFQVRFSTSMLFVFPKPIFIRQERCYGLRLCSNLFTVCKVYRQYAAVNQLSRVMRKLTFCICEHKDADQLRGFGYVDSTIPLLSKSEISSLYPSSVAVKPGLCRTRSETRMLVFS